MVENNNKDLEEPLLQKEKAPTQEKQKILFGHVIGCSLLIGIQNFFYALSDDDDFELIFLSFSGFLLISLIFKFLQIKQSKQTSKNFSQQMIEVFMRGMSSREILLHNIFRALNFFAYIYLLIVITNLCKKANLNIGIAMSLLCFSIVFQIIFGWLYFREKLSKTMIFGILIIISGVSWVSIAKNQEINSNIPTQQEVQNQNQFYLRLQVVGLSIFCAFLSCTRGIQAKYLYLKIGYNPYDFSVDCGFQCAIICLPFFLYYFITGYPKYNTQNFVIGFLTSVPMMLTSLLGLTAVVKGPMGPSMAIIQTHSICSAILGAVFLNMIPNLEQVMAMLLVVAGAMVVFLFK
ncbi:UNKNOWN [Stylonychia lemnae]|uniref:EamA domain-containing protein n=1 Tax=Stylonychia lemnae TaxID=5949 RepID=A0A078ACY8_STYLE|nr:UNKNOWN [Stylonychia lemnae]|eukprot:CDW80115.1 UNKNOWN [Stylonychia lemnae]